MSDPIPREITIKDAPNAAKAPEIANTPTAAFRKVGDNTEALSIIILKPAERDIITAAITTIGVTNRNNACAKLMAPVSASVHALITILTTAAIRPSSTANTIDAAATARIAPAKAITLTGFTLLEKYVNAPAKAITVRVIPPNKSAPVLILSNGT